MEGKGRNLAKIILDDICDVLETYKGRDKVSYCCEIYYFHYKKYNNVLIILTIIFHFYCYYFIIHFLKHFLDITNNVLCVKINRIITKR